MASGDDELRGNALLAGYARKRGTQLTKIFSGKNSLAKQQCCISILSRNEVFEWP
jgi:hypothetical protein